MPDHCLNHVQGRRFDEANYESIVGSFGHAVCCCHSRCDCRVAGPAWHAANGWHPGIRSRHADQPLVSVPFQAAIPNDVPLEIPSTATTPPPLPGYAENQQNALPASSLAATAAPLPEPDFLPPSANSGPPESQYEDNYLPNNDLPADVAEAGDDGGYYEPSYGAPGNNEFAPSGPVVRVANDEEFPAGGNDYAMEPALPPIDELPVEQAPLNDLRGNDLPMDEPPVNSFPSQPATQYSQLQNPEPDPLPSEGNETFNHYQGRARIAIQQPTPMPLEPAPPAAQAFESFASSTGPAPAVDGVRGFGRPGPAMMEGAQTPSLTISKTASQDTQVGKPARFQVVVRNVGSIIANDVVVRDEVPQGTTLVETEPQANRSAEGAVLWNLGSIEPGREARVTMEVMPEEEGEIGSVATISFQTSASARTVSTRPQLTLTHDGLPEALVGDDVIFNIKLTNPGTGVAYNVRLEEDVPDGLRHFDGRELEYKIGDLKPGETRLLELKLKADKPGIVNNLLYARADAGLEVNDEFQFEVVAPGLQVGVEGPRKRYLERRAAFEIAVANPGTAPARDVQVVAQLPRGLRFVDTNNSGHYDSSTHSVRWSLAELPAKEMGTVKLATIPTTMGDQRIRVETTASMGLQASAEHDMTVEGLAALLFTVTDVSDPIEVGGETTYEVHVVNQGTKPASNLRLDASIPAGMEAVNGEGPARAIVESNRVSFEPLAKLVPQADTFYKIHVRGTSAGDKRVIVRLMSDDVTEPVTKEESTHVYSDQ